MHLVREGALAVVSGLSRLIHHTVHPAYTCFPIISQGAIMMSSVGIHLLILSEQTSASFPVQSAEMVHSELRRCCVRRNSVLHASHVLADHMHVLIETEAEDQASEIIADIVATIQKTFRITSRNIVFQDGIHVTLLPPWHLDILSAFVENQDSYHVKYTVSEELERVFLPGLPIPSAAAS
ncbi:MAG: hypothetical protein D8M52_06480 [Chlorobi bacterium]|nr:MAG: hypothetical protein F9K28_06825 [Bacteroidota bacterium]KXK34064.1 MAG: hypothetical protein UZ06_CHB003001466 [Chlorobi bacterium OLB6]MBL1161349.1 hypothetical protein [Chlorobiota bacterium]MBV6462715.1 hypothetical protein [Chlorobiota bacterium]